MLATFLSISYNLKQLTLSRICGTNQSDDFIKELVSLLDRSAQHIPNLRYLDFSRNLLNNETAVPLARAILRYPKLTHLDVSSTGLAD